MKTYYAINRYKFVEEFIRNADVFMRVNASNRRAVRTLFFAFSTIRLTIEDESTYQFNPTFEYQETKLDKSLVYTHEQMLNGTLSCTRIEDFQTYHLGFPLPIKVEPCFLFSNLAVNTSAFSWRGPIISSVEFAIHNTDTQFYEIQNQCNDMIKKILKALADNYAL